MSSLSVNNNQDNDVNDNHFQDMTTLRLNSGTFELIYMVIAEIYDVSDLLRGLYGLLL